MAMLVRNLLEFWLPKMDSMILHQFHVPRNCPAWEMVIIIQLGGPNSFWFLRVWLSWWCHKRACAIVVVDQMPPGKKTQGLDTFEVYLGATVLALKRKLSSRPWLKYATKNQQILQYFATHAIFWHLRSKLTKMMRKRVQYLMYPYGQSTLGP